MKSYKKTLLGSIVAFFVGTSCCWLSSLAIWLGGAAILGTITSLIEDAQTALIAVGVILLIVSLYLYLKKRRKKSTKKIVQNSNSS